MKITYRIESSDIAAYIGSYLRGTPDGKRQVLNRSLAPSVTCCAILACLGLIQGNVGLVVLALLLFPPAFLLARWMVLGGWQRNAARFASTNSEMLGERELELTADALVERGNGSESRISLGKVRSVVDATSIIVINIGGTQAYVVPKRHLTDEQIAVLLKLNSDLNKWVVPSS